MTDPTPQHHNPAEIAVARVEGEIIIHRPIEEVFGFVADERNEPHYNPHMIRAERINEGPIGRGTRFTTELRTGGRTMPMTVEFTTYERAQCIGSFTRSSMMETEGALTFEPVAGGTRMRWSWDMRPRSVLKFMGPVASAIGRRHERTIWGSLKRLLEADLDRSSVTSGAPNAPSRALALLALNGA